MRPRSVTLTPQELEIMKVVWQKGDVTVRDVSRITHSHAPAHRS